MTPADLVLHATGNLWRMKLRTGLTVAGVVIGVGMLVSMLSFGVGVQHQVHGHLERLDLFNTLVVTQSPAPADDAPAPVAPRSRLDDDAVREIEAIPDVRRVYPFDVFAARIERGGRSVPVDVQVVSPAMRSWEAFRDLAAGRLFADDDAREIVLRSDMVDRLGYADPVAAVGSEVTVVTARNHLARIARDLQRLRHGPFAAADDDPAGSSPVAAWFGAAVDLFRSFADLEAGPFREVRYDFTVAGVFHTETRNLNIRSVLVPAGTASGMEKTGISNILDLAGGRGNDRDRYAALVVNARELDVVDEVSRALADRGYQAFSFAENFEEITRGLFLFDLFVAAIALVAVIVAALGIVNTLVMSTIERTREIGILKSLGAEDRHIRRIFLVEAGVIGLLGAIGGDLLGWIVARTCAFIGQRIMIHQGVPPIDPFRTPLWLFALGLVLGIAVSLIAGVYPAHRAARVDPIRALRQNG